MQLSARNQLKGTITAVDRGPISARVQIDIGGGNTLSSTITCNAAEELGLAVGDAVTAIIKSSDVIVGK
ncbi:MAG: transporter [Alphaproteobacteria bacterium]|jgi:molybdopterin-binding protein|nr:transporter [Alphaproteobacteria bacterium]